MPLQEVDREDIEISQGQRFRMPLQYRQGIKAYRPVTGVAKSAPCRITAVAHGLTDSWLVRVTGVAGMLALNRPEPYPVTVIDADHVDLNEVNSLDFPAYASGGVLEFYLPVDMAGCTALLEIRDQHGNTPLISITDATDDTAVGRITLDNAAKLITVSIAPAKTLLLVAQFYVYRLAIIDTLGDVQPILEGDIRVYLK